MVDAKHILIVASIRARTGKTLLARLLADHLTLAGDPARKLFDTDAADRRLSEFFPGAATVVDLERVPDQMKLFDALGSSPATSQVIDLTHRSFTRFFGLMRDINYAEEAKSAGIEPVILFIPDGTAESFDQALKLRETFRDCGFVLVKNEATGEPSRDALNGPGMIGLADHKPTLQLPLLDPFFASAIADTRLSLSEFMRHSSQREAPALPAPGQASLAYLSREARHGIAAWLHFVFGEIRRALQYTDIQARIVTHDRFGV